MQFANWFFNKLPHSIRSTDSYPNYEGKGLLQRYLEIYGDELDQNIYPYIENLLDIIDLLKCEDKHLTHVASILGYPPSINSDPDIYRKLLLTIIAIYKVKGTQLSYQMLFSIMGLDAIILEDMPKKKITYDLRDETYDEDISPETYDSECDNCSGYRIAYNSSADVCSVPNPAAVSNTILTSLQNILPFLEPINAKFLGFVKTIKVCDTMALNLTETTNLVAP